MFGEGKFFYGPLHGRLQAFVGRPPDVFRVPMCPEIRAYDFGADCDHYPPLCADLEIAEYRRKVVLDSGLSIYEYIEPMETAEIAVVVRVPKSMSTRERARIAQDTADLHNAYPGVSARLHYTGPVR
jgi:hypothetical protein